MLTDLGKIRIRDILIRSAVPDSEFSPAFIRGMLDRMATSFFKYGPVKTAYPEKVDAMASLRQRLDAYQSTGNTEYLMDAANFCMIEFMHPAHPQAHYRATDSAESPGRSGRTAGAQNQQPNDSRIWDQRPTGGTP